MAPGERSKFGAPRFEPEVFRKQMYSIEEGTCDIFGTIRRPGIVPACPPPYALAACGTESETAHKVQRQTLFVQGQIF